MLPDTEFAGERASRRVIVFVPAMKARIMSPLKRKPCSFGAVVTGDAVYHEGSQRERSVHPPRAWTRP